MAPKKSGKSVTPKELSMDDMRRLGMTDEQIQEITTLRQLTLEEKRVQKEQRDQAAMERDRAARAAKREAERQAALQLEAAQQEALIRYAAKEREEELNRMAELRRLVEERRRLIDEAKETLLEIDETDREWSEAEERHLYEIALAEREARERGVAKPRSVHRDVLLSRCCRDPLFATMALVLYAERLVKGSPRLPPISPMMMQMVNTHSEEWIPVGKLSDDDMRSSPRWNHYVQCCGDVGAIRLMKPLARLRGIKCNQLPSLDLMRTISYHGARSLHTIDLSFTGPKVDIDWTSPVQDKDDDFRRTLQWLGSLSHLRAVTLRGSLVGSVAGLELLPRLTHLSLSGTMVTDVNVLAAAQGLRVLDLSHTPVTSDGIRNLYLCEALEDLNLNFCSNDLYIHALTRSSSIRRLGCRRSHVPRPDPDGLEYARVACRIATIEVIEVSQITCEDVGPICAKRPPVKLIIDLSKSFNVFKQFPALLPFMPSLQIASTNSNFDSVAFDWSRFNHLTEVAVVSRFNHAVIDLNRLAELTSLQILHLDHQTSAVGSLKRARSLQELTLLQCSASATDQILHDLCFLPRLEKVECVSSDLKTLTIFNGCERLKSLRIEGCTSLLREDKTFVNVPLLERIVIKECEKFTDAQSLLSLPSIAHLTLTKTGVIDEKIFERQVELLSQKRLYNSWFKTHSSNEDQP